ncbi:MAG: hypothetical protein M1830_008353 [Pleopsidium flavum]|nr:MAG: hypothetical protein M1830_008353 [Pleopsidium flavum]
MGNRSSKPEGTADPGRSKKNSTRSSSTIQGKTANHLDDSGWDAESKTDAGTLTSTHGSVFGNSRSESSTICPTQLPPPRTMEGAYNFLTCLRTEVENRHLEVQGLVTGLGGTCGGYDRWRKCHQGDGHLVHELIMTEDGLRKLERTMYNGGEWNEETPVIWSQELLHSVFKLLDGYGRAIEDVLRVCGVLRDAQTGERLPETSDEKWLKANVTPLAADIAARLKHLKSRSEVVHFDVDRAAKVSGRSDRFQDIYSLRCGV